MDEKPVGASDGGGTVALDAAAMQTRIAELETALDALIEATLGYFPQELPPRIGEALERGQELIKTLES